MMPRTKAELLYGVEASPCRAHDATAEFERVRDLNLANWTLPARRSR